MNSLYLAHVGYENSNPAIAAFFSDSTARFIQSKVTELLRTFYPPGIIVPCDRIVEVMNDIYRAYRPSTGDPMTRYVIPSLENPNYVDELINQVVEVITSDVKNNLLTEQRNSKLTIWTTLFGDFNEHGLRQHAPIKLQKKRPKTMLFNMRY